MKTLSIFVLPALLLFCSYQNCKAGESYGRKKAQTHSNPCGVTASFTPGVDTFFSTDTYIAFTNTSSNAISIQWQMNGINIAQTNTFGYYFLVGTYELALIAINGNCRDTFSIMIVNAGIPPDDKLFFSGIIGMPSTNEIGMAITATADSGFLLAGVTNFPNAPNYNTSNCLFVKVKNAGCVEWSKAIIPSTDLSGNASVFEVKSLSDSGYFVSGTTRVVYYLMRLDKAGRLVWARETTHASASPGYKHLIEMKDGSLVAITSPFSGGFSVTKMDPGGTVLWDKSLEQYDYITTNAIIEWQDALYVTGIFKLPDTSIVRTAPFTSFITKLNPANGQLIWSKTYHDDEGMGILVQDLQLYDTLLLAGALNYKREIITVRPVLFWIDTSGNLTKSISINQDQHILEYPTGLKMGVLPGGNIMLHFKAREKVFYLPGYVNYGYYLKIDKDTNVLANQSTIGADDDAYNALSFNGRAFGSIGSAITTVIPWGLTSNNFIFTMRDSTGIDHGCSWNDNQFYIRPFNLIPLPLQWARDTLLQTTFSPVTFGEADAFPQMKSTCPGYIDSCAILRIVGKKSVCDIGATYTYKAGRNSKCPQPVEWSCSSGITILNQTDSSLTVQFNAFGRHNITAMLRNGCNPVKDSIIVIAASTTTTLNLGTDTSLCTGNSMTIHASPVFLSYYWHDGSTDSVFTVYAPGLYWVSVIDSCGNVMRDSVKVTAASPVLLDLGPDRYKCDEDTLHLTAPAGFMNYSWSNNYNISSQSGQSVVINPGVDTAYYLRAEKTPGCFGFDTVRVTVRHSPVINLGSDTTLCEDDVLQLDAGHPGSYYLWQNNSTVQTYSVNSAGQYFVKVTKEGCYATDTINIFYERLPGVSLGPDFGICEGQSIFLQPMIQSASDFTYLWQNGSTANSFTVTQPGLYSVEIINYCGAGRDEVMVTKGVCKLYVPTAFSPNGDGLNEIFKVEYGENLTKFQFEVYNRWGEKVFMSKNISNGWNGKTNGIPQPNGAYVWLIRYKTVNETQEKLLKGTVLLVR